MRDFAYFDSSLISLETSASDDSALDDELEQKRNSFSGYVPRLYTRISPNPNWLMRESPPSAHAPAYAAGKVVKEELPITLEPCS